MKLKLLTLIPMLGLTSTAPVAVVTTSNVANTVALNANKDENKIEIGNKLSEVKSINMSGDRMLRYDTTSDKKPSFTNINSMISVEGGHHEGAKDPTIERADLFTYSKKTKQFESYHRYKSNHIELSNTKSWGNAKKYELLVTVPANTSEYKVEVVANCKIKNRVTGTISDPALGKKQYDRSFMQGNLSKLSTNPSDTLLPTMGITENEKQYASNTDFKIVNPDSFLFSYAQGCFFDNNKPHFEAKLSNTITLSNTSNESKVMPIYFWYGFFGGGYVGDGVQSHINCSEVTFSANVLRNEKIQISNKLKEVNSINKSCDKLLKYEKYQKYVSFQQYPFVKNINSLLTLEADKYEGAETGKIERADLFKMTNEKVTEFDAYYRYISNHVDKSNKTAYGNAKKYELLVTVPAGVKECKVEIVANCKIKLVSNPKGFAGAKSFFQANLSNLSTNKDQQLLPVIGLKDDGEYMYSSDFVNQKDDSYLYMHQEEQLCETKPYKTFKLSKTITLSNETNAAKDIPVYFWYSFFGGGYLGDSGKSQINCSEVTFSANRIYC